MAMDWLKGLVGPTAQFIPPGQPFPQGMPGMSPAGAPPAAGAPWTPPGMQPGGPPPGGAPAWSPAAAQPGFPTGAPFPGQPVMPAGVPAQPGTDAARIAALEARCESLQHDLESVALFARTLLTLLQDRQMVTPEQFLDTKNKLDMLDGKLDDRIAPGR